MAHAYLFKGDHDVAADWGKQALRQPGAIWPMAMFTASALGHLGKSKEASDAVDEIFRLFPEFNEQRAREVFAIGEPELFDHLFAGFREAG